jgi:hypothetical protein
MIPSKDKDDAAYIAEDKDDNLDRVLFLDLDPPCMLGRTLAPGAEDGSEAAKQTTLDDTKIVLRMGSTWFCESPPFGPAPSFAGG